MKIRWGAILGWMAVVAVLAACQPTSSPEFKPTPSSELEELAPRTPPRSLESPISPGRPTDGIRMATDIYGTLRVRPGFVDSLELNSNYPKPWSAWWYPTKKSFLFRHEDPTRLSPLEKYDLYVRQTGQGNSEAAKFEEAHFFREEAEEWEGVCNAASAASLLAREPKRTVQKAGITFEVADLRALLVKTYENVEGLDYIGQKNQDRSENVVFADIYPDQLHRILQVTLFERGEPIMLDQDAGVQVWNHGIVSAQSLVLTDHDDPSRLHVTTWLMKVDYPKGPADFNSRYVALPTYTYDLIGQQQADGDWLISYGVWTGSSIKEHPDFVTLLPPRQVEHYSNNPHIKTKIVLELLEGS